LPSDHTANSKPGAGDEAWVVGDVLGQRFPTHPEALREGGAAFLTEAFRVAGVLGADNRVTRITRFEDCPGGSTGRKLMLGVAYETPAPGLETELFVKFSRDFDSELRDRGKDQMEQEVQFALISRVPGFPVAVPHFYFADYHKATGGGILITERVWFGEGAIEPHYEKCLDYHLPEPLGHYRALLKANARLAGTHRAGRLPDTVANNFPFDAAGAIAADPIRYNAQQLQNRVARFADFFAAYPQIWPDNIRDPDFLARLSREVPRLLEHEQAIKRFLYSDPRMIALCHWNANIDNAWFWRDEAGQVRCGLMDWGRVNQMNIALAVWGSLSGAEKDLWDAHLDELLELFVTEYREAGGPAVEASELKIHLGLFVALLGLGWLMDAPPLIQRAIPDLAEVKDRFDHRFEESETARTQLHMSTLFLNLWQSHDVGAVLDQVLTRIA
jgi:hypothetical protein